MNLFVFRLVNQGVLEVTKRSVQLIRFQLRQAPLPGTVMRIFHALFFGRTLNQGTFVIFLNIQITGKPASKQGVIFQQAVCQWQPPKQPEPGTRGLPAKARTSGETLVSFQHPDIRLVATGNVIRQGQFNGRKIRITIIQCNEILARCEPTFTYSALNIQILQLQTQRGSAARKQRIVNLQGFIVTTSRGKQSGALQLLLCRRFAINIVTKLRGSWIIGQQHLHAIKNRIGFLGIT